MSRFSQKSLAELATCHPKLQKVFNEVIKHFKCTVLCGYRGKVAQNTAYKEGTSKLRYPQSPHNKKPSLGVDVAPHPLNWKEINRFYYFGGFVRGIASQMGIPIRWGGDWNSDTQIQDQKFNDLVHFETKC